MPWLKGSLVGSRHQTVFQRKCGAFHLNWLLKNRISISIQNNNYCKHRLIMKSYILIDCFEQHCLISFTIPIQYSIQYFI